MTLKDIFTDFVFTVNSFFLKKRIPLTVTEMTVDDTKKEIVLKYINAYATADGHEPKIKTGEKL